MKKRAFALMTALSMTGTMLAGCQKEEAETMSQTVNVDTEVAESGTLALSSDYMGSVSASESVNVTPLVSGTVEKVYVKVGDTVKKGDVLCEFDDTSAQYNVDSAQISADAARASKKSSQSQQDLSSASTNSTVASLKTQLSGYKKSLADAKSQLKTLQDNTSTLKSAASTTQKAYQTAKTQYKNAQSLYIKYQSFLTANADCQTTTGLLAAATASTTATTAAPVTGTDGTDTIETTDNTTSTTTNNAQKTKTAQALQKELAEKNLMVEYLTQTGLDALKENASDAETAYNSAASSYAEATSGAATLQSTISTLESQIKATQASIDSANSTKGLTEQAAEDAEDALDAQIDAADLGVDVAEYQASMYTVTAPMDGVIDTVNVKENEVFGSAAAFTISGKEAVTVTYYVTEEVKDFIQVGDAVTVESNGDEYEGTVSTIATSVDATKKLFKVEAQVFLEASQSIGTGTSVKLSMTTAESSGNVLIPYDSVYYDDNQAYIFTVEDGRAVRTDVETGLYNDDTIEITSGLEEGDVVITSWASGLKNGTQISTGEGDE